MGDITRLSVATLQVSINRVNNSMSMIDMIFHAVSNHVMLLVGGSSMSAFADIKAIYCRHDTKC